MCKNDPQHTASQERNERECERANSVYIKDLISGTEQKHGCRNPPEALHYDLLFAVFPFHFLQNKTNKKDRNDHKTEPLSLIQRSSGCRYA